VVKNNYRTSRPGIGTGNWKGTYKKHRRKQKKRSAHNSTRIHILVSQRDKMPSYIVTGGTGNTSSKLSALLHAAGHNVIVASTKGPGGVSALYTGVKFDWYDESTYLKVLKRASDVKGIYIVAAPATKDVEGVKKFIQLARDSGVNRFVVISATAPPPPWGEIDSYIKGIAKEGVEWTLLRPSWFYGKMS
jgi:nucleoside-diphosphate-sugar epimerase